MVSLMSHWTEFEHLLEYTDNCAKPMFKTFSNEFFKILQTLFSIFYPVIYIALPKKLAFPTYSSFLTDIYVTRKKFTSQNLQSKQLLKKKKNPYGPFLEIIVEKTNLIISIKQSLGSLAQSIAGL